MGSGTSDFSTIGMISSLVGGGAKAAGGYAEGGALRAQGNAQGAAYDLNASMDSLQAQDAKRRGDIVASQEGERTRQLVGAQRVATAANGLRVDQGSAGAIQAETEGLGALDRETARHNAYLEAMGYQMRGASDTAAARFARMGGRNAARGVEEGGLLGAAKDWTYGAYRYGKLQVPEKDASGPKPGGGGYSGGGAGAGLAAGISQGGP